MRPLVVLAILLAAPLLAGCTSLDDAQRSADELRGKLDTARNDLEAARARYDRVKSLQVVREERADLVATPVVVDGILRFDLAATRGNLTLPGENLTRAPRIILWFENEPLARVGCDPVTCLFRLEGRTVEMAWEDHADERATFPPACGTTASPTCAMPRLVYEDAPVLATTSVSDASS